MRSLNILALTNHEGHSNENALYRLLATMSQHPDCARLEVASRGLLQNAAFFREPAQHPFLATTVNANFQWTPEGDAFVSNARQRNLSDFDAIWLRLPPPIDPVFLKALSDGFSGKIINDPKGILAAGSKEFLLNFPSITPKSMLINSMADVEASRKEGPLVLKPLRGYGGKGIVRIDGDRVWEGATPVDFQTFKATLENTSFEFLGMEFLEHVGQGDKRIVVVDGQIMGASLRLPAEGSWLCNVAAGGTSNPARVDAEEENIVATVEPVLRDLGIVMYGVDTLMGNHGKRILSELNVTSIGGLPQIERMNGEPLVERAIDLIIKKM